MFDVECSMFALLQGVTQKYTIHFSTVKTETIVFPRPHEVAFREFDVPPCGPDEIVAETLYSFVSPGTELRVWAGTHESADKFPLVPGYSWVGRVIEAGHNLAGWDVGQLVTGRNPMPIDGITQLWGGQASRHRAAVSGNDAVLKLPDNADPWDYVTVETSAISWRGVSSAFPAAGETAMVVGQGLIGAFAARWLLMLDVRVLVTDLETSRLDRARAWGAVAAIHGSAPDVQEQILSHFEDGADLVIEASGSAAGARLAASILRQPAAQRGNDGYPLEELHTHAGYWPRLVYQASAYQNMELPPRGLAEGEGVLVLSPADRRIADRLAVIEHIRRGCLRTKDIVERPTPVDDAPQAYRLLRDHPERVSAVAFQWGV
jgi:2-desacetyl-2-hydroxyethyl bacteriochlorophyllide A dehydrogenase